MLYIYIGEVFFSLVCIFKKAIRNVEVRAILYLWPSQTLEVGSIGSPGSIK